MMKADIVYEIDLPEEDIRFEVQQDPFTGDPIVWLKVGAGCIRILEHQIEYVEEGLSMVNLFLSEGETSE